MENLNLHEIFKVVPEAFSILLASNLIENLKILDISSCNLDDNCLEIFSKRKFNIKRLNIYDFHLKSLKFFQNLVESESFINNIEKLNLTSVNIDVNGKKN